MAEHELRPSPLTTLLEDPGVPIERLAVEIAMDVMPATRRETVDRALDSLAAPLVTQATSASPKTRGELLISHFRELGFEGDDENYFDPLNSLLPSVLDRRKGIPLSLAMVLMALGRRIGVHVEGIGFPGHFLARVEGVLVDPFDGAHPLTDDDLASYARCFVPGGEVREEFLKPLDALAMTVRMLVNLRNAYARQKAHGQAFVVCHRLFELTGAPEAQRDRGLHALSLGCFKSAEEDLARYLEARPDRCDRDLIEASLMQARRQKALLH